jgi:hypothetical protein
MKVEKHFPKACLGPDPGISAFSASAVDFFDFSILWLMSESLDEVAFKIEVIEKSGEVTSPHPAGFGRARPRATKRSAPAAAARHLLGARRSAI